MAKVSALTELTALVRGDLLYAVDDPAGIPVGKKALVEMVVKGPDLLVAAADAVDQWKKHADYICDGTADEVQIQAAIDALPAVGGRVLLSPGNYSLVAGTLVDFGSGFDTYNCILIDEDAPDVELIACLGAILKLADTQPAEASMVLVGGVSTKRTARTLISSIEFDGNAANQAETSNDFGCVCVVQADNVTIEHNYIHDWDANSSGIFTCWGSQKIRISHNTVQGNKSGMRLHNSYHIVTDNVLLGTAGATAGAMLECVIDEVGFGQSANILIANNAFINGFIGLSIQGISSSVVANNTFSFMTDASAIAIKLAEYDGGAPLQFHCTNNVVQGNVIYNCSNGIYCTGSASYGSRNNLIYGNNILDGPDTNISYGIYEAGAANSGNRIFDNFIDSGASAKVSVAGAGAYVFGNANHVTRNGGTASKADGGTIAHGLVAAPTKYQVTSTAAGHIVAVTAVDATNLTIALKDHDGSAIAGAENVNWMAEV